MSADVREEMSKNGNLAEAYRDYVNALGLTDGSGNALTLEDGGEGIANFIAWANDCCNG